MENPDFVPPKRLCVKCQAFNGPLVVAYYVGTGKHSTDSMAVCLAFRVQLESISEWSLSLACGRTRGAALGWSDARPTKLCSCG